MSPLPIFLRLYSLYFPLSKYHSQYYNTFMLIVVGSDNPAKINGVRNVFLAHFAQVNVRGVFIRSGVSETPLTDTEIFQGAMNRAKGAMEKISDADFGVGVEGGMHRFSYGWVKYELVIILDKKGTVGIGTSGGLQVPENIIEPIKAGKTLTVVGDKLFNTTRIGKGMGIVGYFTKGFVTRADAVEHGTAMAISKFINAHLY